MTTGMNADAAVAEVRRILLGIDREEECDSEPGGDVGWWETSSGAEFGAAKLAELEGFIRTQLLPEDEGITQ